MSDIQPRPDKIDELIERSEHVGLPFIDQGLITAEPPVPYDNNQMENPVAKPDWQQNMDNNLTVQLNATDEQRLQPLLQQTVNRYDLNYDVTDQTEIIEQLKAETYFDTDDGEIVELEIYELNDGLHLYAQQSDLKTLDTIFDELIYDREHDSFLLAFSNHQPEVIDAAIDLHTGTIGTLTPYSSGLDQRIPTEFEYTPRHELSEIDINLLNHAIRDFYVSQSRPGIDEIDHVVDHIKRPKATNL